MSIKGFQICEIVSPGLNWSQRPLKILKKYHFFLTFSDALVSCISGTDHSAETGNRPSTIFYVHQFLHLLSCFNSHVGESGHIAKCICLKIKMYLTETSKCIFLWQNFFLRKGLKKTSGLLQNFGQKYFPAEKLSFLHGCPFPPCSKMTSLMSIRFVGIVAGKSKFSLLDRVWNSRNAQKLNIWKLIWVFLSE